MSEACEHEWGRHVANEPLHCLGCGVLWPGRPLPLPYSRYPGLGELAQQPSWTARVDSMVN
jgi:hypothetical protein